VQVLLATDAAGEGINLQRAHLMVNYDLPWNPNRLEQRFGRIHRIGQTEVCYLWNLVADDTREGDVYRKLLEKARAGPPGPRRAGVRRARQARLRGADGKVMSLRELLIEAIRYGERPETKAFLTTVLDTALDKSHLQSLLDERQLVHDSMDASAVCSASARTWSAPMPAACNRTTSNPSSSKPSNNWAATPGNANPAASRSPMFLLRCATATASSASANRCCRATSASPSRKPSSRPRASRWRPSSAPATRLLDAVIDLTLERNRDLLKRGTVLVDERDLGTEPRVCSIWNTPFRTPA
jgi:superfamily II DNA/RNA helicase